MEIRPVGAEVFHEDGQTDGRTDTDDEAFRNFCEKRPKNQQKLCCDRKSPV